MGNKLFVGGLAWATTNESLRTAFEPFGKVVDARVITDRDTGRSRGFGFVTYEEDDSAAKAIEAMHGADVDGRSIRVNEAEERRGGGRPGGPPRRSAGPPRDRSGPGRSYPPVEHRAGGGEARRGPPPGRPPADAGPPLDADEGKPVGRKRHNGGGGKRRSRKDTDEGDFQRGGGGGGRKRRGGGNRRRFDDHHGDW